MPVGVVERLLRRAHREDDEIIDLALVLVLHPLVGIEGAVGAVAARNHAGDAAGQIRHVERIDLPGAALAVEDALPGRLDAAAEWRHHAEARDDNPPHIQDSSPLSSRPTTRSRWTAVTARPASSAPRGVVSFSRSFQGTWWRRRRSESSPPHRRESRSLILLRTPSPARPYRDCRRRGRQ